MGLIAITIYLVVERAIATGIPVAVATKQLLLWDASNAYGATALYSGWGTAATGLLMDLIVSTCGRCPLRFFGLPVALVIRSIFAYGGAPDRLAQERLRG